MFYQRGCDGGDGFTCWWLAGKYSQGQLGLPKDAERARALYRRACKFDREYGCGA
jgi:TPR repeat protein